MWGVRGVGFGVCGLGRGVRVRGKGGFWSVGMEVF